MLNISSNRYKIQRVEWLFTEKEIKFVSVKDTGIYVVDLKSEDGYPNYELELINGLLDIFIEDFPQFFIGVKKYDEMHEIDFPF